MSEKVYLLYDDRHYDWPGAPLSALEIVMRGPAMGDDEMTALEREYQATLTDRYRIVTSEAFAQGLVAEKGFTVLAEHEWDKWAIY